MRSFAVLVLVTLSAGVAVVCAQTSQTDPPPSVQPVPPPPSQAIAPPSGGDYYGGYPDGYHRSSTAAEGAMRGMADVVRSQGQANLNNSAAAINYSVARRNQIDNRYAWTNTYFEMRRSNRAYRAAERRPRPTMEQATRLAQAGMPKPLSPTELDTITGAIRWPTFLQSETYAAGRAELERIFAYRARDGAIGADDFVKARKATDAMLAGLKEQVREIPPAQYVAGKRFLQSLRYEVGQPLG